MTKTLNIPNAAHQIEIDADAYEENEVKEMEKSLHKYWIGQLIGLVRKSENIGFVGAAFLEHTLRTLLFDGNQAKAFLNI